MLSSTTFIATYSNLFQIFLYKDIHTKTSHIIHGSPPSQNRTENHALYCWCHLCTHDVLWSAIALWHTGEVWTGYWFMVRWCVCTCDCQMGPTGFYWSYPGFLVSSYTKYINGNCFMGMIGICQMNTEIKWLKSIYRSSRFWRSALAPLWTLLDTRCCLLTCESSKEMVLTSDQWMRWEQVWL